MVWKVICGLFVPPSGLREAPLSSSSLSGLAAVCACVCCSVVCLLFVSALLQGCQTRQMTDLNCEKVKQRANFLVP